MGSVQPSREQLADIDFGWPLLLTLVELEVGRSIAVRERDVIAVEAAETSESMIRRAGDLCRARGWVTLKTAAPDDRPPKLPAIDVDTIEQIAAAGGGCIAVSAGKVLLADKPAVLEAADRAKIAVVGVGATNPRVEEEEEED